MSWSKLPILSWTAYSFAFVIMHCFCSTNRPARSTSLESSLVFSGHISSAGHTHCIPFFPGCSDSFAKDFFLCHFSYLSLYHLVAYYSCRFLEVFLVLYYYYYFLLHWPWSIYWHHHSWKLGFLISQILLKVSTLVTCK